MKSDDIKAICICLPENPASIESARSHFKEVGLDNVEFFWGINAYIAGLATWHVYERDNPGSGFRMGAKPTGCWLSHYMLWNMLTRLPDEHFMILEVDAKFHSDWKPRLDQALKDVPVNFDLLFTGHCCMEGHPKELVAGEVFRTTNIQCTHSYIVRRWSLQFLLRTLRKVWAPLDIQLQLECFPNLKTYAVVPRIVSQFGTDLPP